MPGRAFFSMASACSGMSGRLQASGAGRQIVGVGLARDLEYRDGEALRHCRTRGEPLGIGPGLHDRFRVGVAAIGQRLHIVEIVEHQKRVLQALGRSRTAFAAGQKIDQRLDVEAAQHGAEQLGRPDLGDQRAGLLALGNFCQELGFDLGRIVHARRHAVGDEVNEESFFARGRIFQKANQLARLLRGQRQRRNAKGGAFGNMGAV